ncbi:MAG: hypothetical protein BMS9Abin08_0396 [Gammaproteobacteria bacterium]|nr:MAG: hypothetical protein BMS9Abin08_0396 [Gammaproteobacteria bacterium]
MRKLLIITVIMVLTACQPMTVQRSTGSVPVPVAVRIDDAAYWLEEWQQLIKLPDEQLKQILEIRRQEFIRSAEPRTRLRLALLLAAGPKSVRDQERALKLLKGLDMDRADDSARALAALLQQNIEEQNWSGDKIAGLREKLTQSEARIEELERQLHEFTTIEQNIQQRETPN